MFSDVFKRRIIVKRVLKRTVNMFRRFHNVALCKTCANECIDVVSDGVFRRFHLKRFQRFNFDTISDVSNISVF